MLKFQSCCKSSVNRTAVGCGLDWSRMRFGLESFAVWTGFICMEMPNCIKIHPLHFLQLLSELLIHAHLERSLHLLQVVHDEAVDIVLLLQHAAFFQFPQLLNFLPPFCRICNSAASNISICNAKNDNTFVSDYKSKYSQQANCKFA